jgi:hypothetical protein
MQRADAIPTAPVDLERLFEVPNEKEKTMAPPLE